MSKIAISLLLTLVFVGGTGVGLILTGRSRDSCSSCKRLGEELSRMQEGLESLRGDSRILLQEVRRLESLPPDARGSVDAVSQDSNPNADDRELGNALALADRPEAIKGYLLAALDEDRRQREAEREQQREESKQRAEARKKEQAELKEGPYEKLNVKVNSAAKALGLNDSQKQAYYELLKASRDKLSEARKKPAEEAAASQGAAVEGARSKGREEFKRLREALESAQKEFVVQVQSILTPAQLETYNHLPESGRGILSLGSVSDAGPTLGGPGGGFGAGGPGRRRGGPEGGGR